jgi:hypothetical protein
MSGHRSGVAGTTLMESVFGDFPVKMVAPMITVSEG